MPTGPETNTQLATFDAPLADAVVTVLRREGVPAAARPLGDGEVEVRVPAARRDEALALLADRMEDVRAEVHGGDGSAPTSLPLVDGESAEDESGPPLVMDRLRRMGLGVVIVLAPLLVITLAQPNLPVGYALALFVVGLVAVVFWVNRGEQDD